MRLIGTAVALAAALMLATVGVADAKKGKRGGGAKVYKFTVECPVLSPVPWTKGTCSAKGKTPAAARAVCESQNNLCYVKSAAKKKGGKKGKK
jgi:hypothetical protein